MAKKRIKRRTPSATPRKRRTTRRRRRTMSEGSVTLGRKKRTRRRRTRKSGLSEIFTPNTFKDGGKAFLNGSLGGGIGFVVDLLVPEGKPGLRFLGHAATSLVLGGAFNLPMMGAGVAGAYANSLANELYANTLSEMENINYANKNSMDKYPDALDENGNPMYLAEDGNFYYLEEFSLAEDGNYYLSQDMQAKLYPGYVNPII